MNDLTITVTPAPKGATPLHPDPGHGCTCSIMEGRCVAHSMMMAEIRLAWNGPGCERIRELADGYGYPGSMIDLDTYDWSGVRDSTEATIERIHEAISA